MRVEEQDGRGEKPVPPCPPSISLLEPGPPHCAPGPQQAGYGPWPSAVASTVLTMPPSWGRRLRPVSSPQVATTSSRNCSTVVRSQLQWLSSSLAALTRMAPALHFLPRARCCRAAARCSLA